MKKFRKSRIAKVTHSAEDNPFETRGILNKKHNVFNRKVKGETRNVAKARGQATQRREKTLLVDYERSQKANSFSDRRFGEDDDSLLLEEKMWARMQKERKKRSRGMGAFHLGEGQDDEDRDQDHLLTHRGQALGNYGDHDVHVDALDGEQDDDGLDAEVVNRLHFGDGSEGKDKIISSQSHVSQGEKTRHEILSDIIARSKERKLEKARGKEEQESERERLDEGMSELLGMLSQRPSKGEGRAGGQSDDYDRTMRELTYEARAQATDRLQTPQEAARAEKARLDVLEKARVERMENQAFDSKEVLALEGRRRRKGRNDDELDEDRASHAPRGDSDGDLESDDSDEGHVSLTNINSTSDNDAFALETSYRMGRNREVGEDDGWSEDDCDGSDGSNGQNEGGYLQSRRSGAKITQDSSGRKELPYVFACPSSYDDLIALLTEHAANADDMNTILDRIHKNHSIKLDSRNKERMHNFYEMLLKRFRRVGTQTGKLSRERQDREKQLNFLVGLIYDMTEEMPEVATSLWHRFVGHLQQGMLKAIADLSMGACTSSCWPGTGSLLLLKLLTHIYPHTDFRHPVVTPVMLYLSQCITQSPVKTSADLGKGLFSCALILHCSLGADRVSPEVLTFVSSALMQFSPSTKKKTLSPAFDESTLQWLRMAAASYIRGDLPAFNLDMSEVVTSSSRREFAVGALASLYQLALRMAQRLEGNVACTELLSPIQTALAEVQPQADPPLPECVKALHADVSRKIATVMEKCISTRRPLLMHLPETPTPAMDALAPKFEESYNMKKDGHKDVEQTRLKQLQRQVKRERKGAIRELKRDAIFLEHAKANKTDEKEQARKRRLRENLTWLEEQQATFNQQVKLGGKLVKGGGSSSMKRARVGRGY